MQTDPLTFFSFQARLQLSSTSHNVKCYHRRLQTRSRFVYTSQLRFRLREFTFRLNSELAFSHEQSSHRASCRIITDIERTVFFNLAMVGPTTSSFSIPSQICFLGYHRKKSAPSSHILHPLNITVTERRGYMYYIDDTKLPISPHRPSIQRKLKRTRCSRGRQLRESSPVNVSVYACAVPDSTISFGLHLHLFAGALSAGLQVVAGDQPDAPVPAVHLGLPPPIVLVSEDGEDITFVKAQLFWDGRLVHVERASWSKRQGLATGRCWYAMYQGKKEETYRSEQRAAHLGYTVSTDPPRFCSGAG